MAGRSSGGGPVLSRTRQVTGYPRFFPVSPSASLLPHDPGSSCGGCPWQRMGRDPEKWHEGSHPFSVWREGEMAGVERKVWASGFLELGFHDDGSDSFSLGRPDP
jgi:hypothetical protein